MRVLFSIKLLAFLLLASTTSSAQKIPKIKVKKDGPFVFYQKGRQSDTIIKGKTDEFVFLVPEKLKPHIVILVANGAFRRTENDSVIRLEPVKFHTYQSRFDDARAKNTSPLTKSKERFTRPDLTDTLSKPRVPVYRFVTEIDGAFEGQKDKILVKFINNLTGTSETTEYFLDGK